MNDVCARLSLPVGRILDGAVTAYLIGMLSLALAAPVGAEQPGSADPFRNVDVVRLFAATDGTVGTPSANSRHVYYSSKRFGMMGRPDARLSISGRLRDRTWVLITPFESGTIGATQAMVYEETTQGIRPLGSFLAPTDHLAVAIVNGRIEESFAVYSSTGSCSESGREVRTFEIRDGALKLVKRRTQPSRLMLTVVSRLPRKGAGSDVRALAARTPGLYRVCFGLSDRHYYMGDGIDLYGMPDRASAVLFATGRTELVAVPFVSGGSGGVFTAAVYRIENGRVYVVRTLRTNGHLTLRQRRGVLEVADPAYAPGDPECCYKNVIVQSYRYDSRKRSLRAVARRRETTQAFMAGR